MKNVEIIAGNSPVNSEGQIQVMMDEGSLIMNGWSIGESHQIQIAGTEIDVTITGSIRGEVARTMFFLQPDFNTMVMNIAERDFELATLRVLGASTIGLGTMLTFESLLIGIIGGLVGVAFAFGGAVGMASSFSTWAFYFPVILVPSVALELMSIVIVIALAMVPIGIWRIRRMNLVEKVKDLSQ